MGDVQFRSFFLGGFECSMHRLRSGKRLDLLEATRHTEFVRADYRRLQAQGICSIRSGIRWHLIEPAPYRYDFSSVLPMIRAANDTGMQVIWDICHYGWPDGLDIFRSEFVDRFAALAQAFARLLREESDAAPLLTLTRTGRRIARLPKPIPTRSFKPGICCWAESGRSWGERRSTWDIWG